MNITQSIEDDLYNSLPINLSESNPVEVSEEYDTPQSVILNNSLPMNPSESNPVEVSEEFDTPQSVISNNSLTMNPTSVEESESNVSSSNEK